MTTTKKKWKSLAERRTQPRLDVDLPVTLRYDGRLIPATALNVSSGGMCLSVPEREFRDDGEMEIILDLSSVERDITVRGKVVRYEDNVSKRIGLQFTNLYTVGHRSIENFLKTHFKKSTSTN
jgi:c-di-GMP-binding flagellar brake protein YcgR